MGMRLTGPGGAARICWRTYKEAYNERVIGTIFRRHSDGRRSCRTVYWVPEIFGRELGAENANDAQVHRPRPHTLRER